MKDVLNMKRVAFILNMMADDAIKNNPKMTNESVLIKSSNPGIPSITIGDIRLAKHEAEKNG
jgi:hypothetical protein